MTARSLVQPHFDPQPVLVDQHYPPNFYAALWGVHESTIRRWFQDLPGVLKLKPTAKNGKRQRVEIRIPYRLALEVYREKTK